MTHKLLHSAAVIGLAIVLADAAHAIDPGRTPGATTPAASNIDPLTGQYLPSGISTIPSGVNPGNVYPGGNVLPGGLYYDDRGRPIGGLTTIPGGTTTGTTPVLPTTFPGTTGGTTTTGASPLVVPGTTTGGSTTTTPQARWRLGVYSKDTDTGVQIIQVVRGSAAERAGLEANDRIVCVAGYQVGYVGGTPYDCANEFERNADANGWVTMLVQNNRDGKLMTLPVQLDSRFSTIDGSITYREQYSLPRDAVINVELRETLRPGAPPVTLARKSITGATTVPVAFKLEYDPSQIDTRRTYQVYATITSGNQMLFTTRQATQVLASGQPRNVAVLVESTVTTQPGQPYVNRDQQVEQIVQWFRQYLQRDPRPLELYVWQSHIDRGGSLSEAQAQILSTPEFYGRCDQNDVIFVQQLHQMILGKQPTNEELAWWTERVRYHNRLRPEVAREFLAAVGVSR
jgi:uncharacterized lipoprotein YbaY